MFDRRNPVEITPDTQAAIDRINAARVKFYRQRAVLIGRILGQSHPTTTEAVLDVATAEQFAQGGAR